MSRVAVAAQLPVWSQEGMLIVNRLVLKRVAVLKVVFLKVIAVFKNQSAAVRCKMDSTYL